MKNKITLVCFAVSLFQISCTNETAQTPETPETPITETIRLVKSIETVYNPETGLASNNQNKEDYKYNEKGQLIEIKEYDNDVYPNGGYFHDIFTYNNSGQIIEITEYNPDDTQLTAEHKILAYNSKGLISTYKEDDDRIVTYIYDQSDRLISSKTDDLDKNSTPPTDYDFEIIMSYDQNNIYSTEKYPYATVPYEDKSVVKVNDSKSITSILFTPALAKIYYYMPGNASVEMLSNNKTITEYSEINKTTNEKILQYTHEFEYDKIGNPIEKRDYNKEHKLIGKTVYIYETISKI
jgi:YD repeat-containing protein